jgi:UDP-N-acetyl-D-mannosaminuronic acid dehydrogenase
MNISVVGGCGHVGLPLSVSLALAGQEVIAFDISEKSVNLVNSGIAPFWEPDLDIALSHALEKGFD